MTSGGGITGSPRSADRWRAPKRTGCTTSFVWHGRAASIPGRRKMLFYRALLRLYPKSFRAEYGAEMMKDFNREGHEASGAAKAALLARISADTLANALRVHG